MAAIVAASTAIADAFDWPLHDAGGVRYGVPAGFLLNGTNIEWLDYGIRNLDQWGVKCYNVDWSRMIHTGEDWYRSDYLTRNTLGTPVYAVADGVVARHNPGLSYPGNVVLIEHALRAGGKIYSMYGHVANVSVAAGDVVTRGQQIATVIGQNYTGRTGARHPSWDSHLHFEMRWFLDGGNIYTPATNAYGYNYPACTWLYPGRGYTYRIHPNAYPYPDAGYVDPSDFIAAHSHSLAPLRALSETLTHSVALPMLFRPPDATCGDVLVNGGFETGEGWAGIANSSGAILDAAIYSSAQAHSGARSGRVGSTSNGIWNEVLQTAALPPRVLSATLSYWRWLDSQEGTAGAFDVFSIGLETGRGIELGAPARIDNTSAGRGQWVFASQPLANAPALSGRSVWVSLKGLTDGSKPSALYVDDVALTVCR